MKFIRDKPKPYKVSFFALLVLLVIAACSIPVSMFISSFYHGWDGLGVLLESMLVFTGFACVAGIISFVSGLSVVKSFRHMLWWLVPQGILLFVSLLYLVAYLFDTV